MIGKIICCVTVFGCAALFYGIGVFAEKSKTPMWFWSGSSVDAAQITDVQSYNRENAVMWKRYSLWYAAAGVAEFWNSIAFMVILILSCTVGLALLVRSYNRIFRKYRVS